ncbi:Short chain dehydrogenase sol3 [Lachnellula suecica]|uniref:Short chain dehydrogenase sol3 n=1 Tax=Lachnellula suecica TaxID=602035 RepID=A0A8T9C2D1_9HELO|nr:Short chain dehydrogenase sol3 [Lachnellula suecica]
MALNLLPVLRKSGKKTGVVPRLTIVTSEVHAWTPLDERKEDSIFDALNKNKPEYMKDRYPTSKLLEILFIRSLARELNNGPHADEKVILNAVNPGLCHSSLTRNSTGLASLVMYVLKMLLARKTEVGARTLVAGAEAGEESHGEYMSIGRVAQTAEFVRSEEGKKTQERVYTELIALLEKIQPGISKNI